MKTQQGYAKKIRAAALFTDEEVLAIRRADRAGMTTRREQARTWGVSVETIARICRGDTYHWIVEHDELLEEKAATESLVEEPTQEERAASQSFLQRLFDEQQAGNKMVKEMKDGTD